MSDLVIEKCVPSEHADEIMALFRRVGRPEFAEVFERAYRVRERTGLRSWIGRSEGKVVLHISVSPETFRSDTSTFTGGILGDLMADPSHRDFWSSTKLAKRMITDIRQDRIADFVMTSYVTAAKAVFAAAGLKPFMSLRRYVLPLHWPYPSLRWVMHRQHRPHLTTAAFDSALPTNALKSPGSLSPLITRDYIITRMPRIGYPEGFWLVAGSLPRPDAMLLVSPVRTEDLLIAEVLCRDGVPLAGLLAAGAKWAANEGYRQVSLSTIPGSELFRAARLSGFLARPEVFALMLRPITAAALPAPEQWYISPFILNTW